MGQWQAPGSPADPDPEGRENPFGGAGNPDPYQQNQYQQNPHQQNPHQQNPHQQNPHQQNPYGQPGEYPQPVPAGYAAGPIPLDQPYYNVGLIEAVVRFFKKYLTFSGRAGRAEFWWWYLAAVVVSVVSGFIGLGIDLGGGGLAQLGSNPASISTVIALVWQLATLVGWTALAVRRLHDTNRTGWWVLLYLPTFAIGVWQIVGPVSTTAYAGSAADSGQLAALGVRALVYLAGGACAIPLLVFYLQAPRPKGRRFDRQG